MQKQQGFTLIELVVVIIILGILAVTAAPKFINLQGDARVSALSGMKAAIQGANTLVYSKAALAGEEKKAKGDNPKVTLATGVVAVTQYGYLQGLQVELEKAMDVTFNIGTSATDSTIATLATNGSDWTIFAAGGVATIWQAGAPDACKLTYTEATSTAIPKYVAETDASKC